MNPNKIMGGWAIQTLCTLVSQERFYNDREEASALSLPQGRGEVGKLEN